MFRVHKRWSPNKLRDVNIAIAYHNTRRSMADVAREFSVSGNIVRCAHHSLVRHISRCLDEPNVYVHESPVNHSETMADYLKQYRDLLIGDGMKVEITVNDLDGQAGVILSTSVNDGRVFVHVCREGNEEVEVDMDDLKAALRKLSAK